MTLWGGRFTDTPGGALWAFTVDHSDRRLLPDDVRGSKAHAAMLEHVGLISSENAALIQEGLALIEDEIVRDEFVFTDGDEDVHSAVERRLAELIGVAAGQLHTGRSRNDQVVLDMRLYLGRTGAGRMAQLRDFVEVLTERAGETAGIVVPTYTHLQQAQVGTLGHHLLAYAWMLLRDIDRFDACLIRIAESPLGAGASAGSSLPLDPDMVASSLDLPGIFANSLDAVASRDFVAEYIFCCAQAMTHLSRLAEELVLWGTVEFGWATYRDRDTTGSSALPQKKNPDPAELARGKAAAVLGDLSAILALQKGLPLSYNRDLQEDKRLLFHADDTLAGALAALLDMVAGATFHPSPPSAWSTALEFAEVLVSRGVPFREAHEVVGRLVTTLLESGRGLEEVRKEDLASSHDVFQAEDVSLADPNRSVSRRVTPGSGSSESVFAQIEQIAAVLDEGGKEGT